MIEQINMFDIMYEKYQIKKPIRLIELFAGYKSQALALKYLGVDFEHHKCCEWAVKSIQAIKDLHFPNDNEDYSKDKTLTYLLTYLHEKGISMDYNQPMTYQQIKSKGEKWIRNVYNNIIATHNLVNISQANGSDLKVEQTDKYDYIMTYSFPCFTADSLVLTSNGYKRICDINNEDLVLSHDNKYHKVVNVFNNGNHDIYKINAMGVDEIKTTYNHKFYVREKYRKGHKSIRCFREPTWKELKDLTKNDYLGIAINQNNTSIVSNKLPMQHNSFWWLIGRYLGDGWLRQQGGIVICCDKKELGEITYHLDELDWHYNIVEERTIYKIHIPKKALSEFCSQFGNSAGTKHLTKDVLDLPIYYLEPFIKGYISADGCFTNGVYKATSISRELIYGISQCVAKVYKTPYRIYKVEPPKTKIIEDRLVNQNNWYQLVFKTEKRKQDKAFYENGYIWYPINSIEYIGKNNVYDIEVEDSHSFTVQNTIVHNCQDLSLAGKRKGMKDTSTRSGLLWEVERILYECCGYEPPRINNGRSHILDNGITTPRNSVVDKTKLPQILVMENVPQVHGKGNKEHFQEWIKVLEKLGYSSYWQDLNAKDYGIPQNRDRCFMISILGDYNYNFPKKIKLKKRLKDLLESEVDEKYFLSDKMISYISASNQKWAGNNNGAFINKDIASTINTGEGSRRCDASNYICDDLPYNFDLQNGCLKIKEKTKKGYAIANDGDGVYINRPHQKRDVVQKGMIQTIKTSPDIGVVVNNDTPQLIGGIGEKKSNGGTQYYQQDRIYSSEGVAMAHPANLPSGSYMYGFGEKQNLRIRKLTPKECWRLMGVKDEDFNLVKNNQSESSLYHLAGDSIVTTVLMAIFGELLNIDYKNKIYDLVETLKKDS